MKGINECKNIIKNSIDCLDGWIDRCGWDGFDPFDIKGHPLFIKCAQTPVTLPKIILGKFLTLFTSFFPFFSRKVFRTKKEINPKAIGLLFTSYCDLFRITSDTKYLGKAESCKLWLIKNSAQEYAGFAWGYPFDWQSKVFIPKGTPSSVTTAHVGDGFWKYYKLTNDISSLNVCKSICEFFINDLIIDEISDEIICFSYTPIDHFHVHNANLFVAEFLIRIGKEIDNKQYIKLGEKAVNYALSEQNEDGSIYYWGNVQNKYSPNHLDHFHSGFEIRMLYSVSKLLNNFEVENTWLNYYNFYKENLFDGTIIKYSPSSVYPIDIHSCAEAILCTCTIKEEFIGNRDWVLSVLEWINNKMLTEEGWYVYQIWNIMGFEYKVKIPFIRWGQAWMMRALSELLVRLNEQN